MAKRLLTPEEVADMFGFHEESVRRLCRQGKLPAAKVGRKWLFDPDILERWIEAGGTPDLPPMLRP